eukprot:8440070-Ditylum_brightwellii.AAC.1
MNDTEKIKNRDLPGVLSLFAEFVAYRGAQHTTYHHMVYKAILLMIVDFANNSRADSGFCL